MTAAATAAAASKFEQASNITSMTTSNGGFSTTNWPNVVGVTADWDLSAVNRTAFDTRLITSSSYYNSSHYGANYLVAYPQNYIRNSTAAAAMAAASTPFNYLTATDCNGLNYHYGNENCASNFIDYYNLNYYGINNNSAAAAMLGTSPTDISNKLLSSRSSSSATNTINDDYKNNQLNNHNENEKNHCNLLMQEPSSSKNEISIRNSGLSPLCSTTTSTQSNFSKIEKRRKSKKKKTSINGNYSAGINSYSNGLLGNRTTPEPNSARVFIWELEDLCVLSSNQYQSIDPLINHALNQVVQYAFHGTLLEEEFTQSNVEESEIDESLQHQEIFANSNNLMQNQSNTAGSHISSLNGNGCINNTTRNAQVLSTTATMNLLSTYPTLNPSTSNATQGNNLNAASMAVAAASVVNREMLEGLRRISAKYKNIKATYNTYAYKDDVLEFLTNCGISSQKEEIIERLREYNNQIERYRRCLRIIIERSHLIKDKCTNIVLTHESLPNAFAKLVTFNLARYVPIENVYSTFKLGKESCLTRITERFRKKHAVIISSNLEFRNLAKQEGIPFWMINTLRDVDAFYFALDTILLADTTNNLQIPNQSENELASKINLNSIPVGNCKTTSPINQNLYI